MAANSVLLNDGFLSSTILGDLMLVLVAVLIVINYINPIRKQFSSNKRLSKTLPQPQGHWLFGHVLLMPNTHEGFFKRVAMTQEFPFLFRFGIGPLFSQVYLHHPDSVKIALTRHGFKGFAYQNFLKEFLGKGLIAANGAYWQRHRTMLTPAFHFDILKPYAKVFNTNASILTDFMEKHIDSADACDISRVYNNITFTNLIQCVMSQDASTNKNFLTYVEAIENASYGVTKRLYNPLLWNDTVFRLTSTGRKYHAACNTIQREVKKYICDRRASVANKSSVKQDDVQQSQNFRCYGKRIDFLDILLQTTDSEGNHLTEQEIIDEVASFFGAGQETTATSMTWTSYLLAINQDCQDRCREEIMSVCGNKSEIEWEDLSKLIYLTKCIKESLRMYPIVPLIGRRLEEPMVLNDPYTDKSYTIEAGTNVICNFFALHRHPDIWEEPDKFDPERFSKDNAAKRSPFAHLPFSAGSRPIPTGTIGAVNMERKIDLTFVQPLCKPFELKTIAATEIKTRFPKGNCIGQNFGMTQMKITLAHALRRYRIYRDSNAPPAQMKLGLTIEAKDGMMLKFERI